LVHKVVRLPTSMGSLAHGVDKVFDEGEVVGDEEGVESEQLAVRALERLGCSAFAGFDGGG
jgi:hypothetical protein